MDSSFDRGEVDRASLEATERLRQRLARERQDRRAPGQRSLLPWAVAGALLMFSAGMIASPWFETRVRDRLPFAQPVAVEAPDAMSEALEARLAALEAKSEAAPPPAERLARTEAKVETSTDLLTREIDRIDKLTADLAALAAMVEAEQVRDSQIMANAQAAAARTEAMLAVLLARRAIEQGRPLGAIEAPLRQAFEARYPAAVRAVLVQGAAPATPERLARDLRSLGPLADGPEASGQSWWDVFSRRVGRLVRPANASVDQNLRNRAEAALARGDVEAAARQLRRLPAPRPAAVDRWLEAADRLAAAEDALRQLETAALLPAPEPVEAAAAKAAGSDGG
jgi:hypothetical protein